MVFLLNNSSYNTNYSITYILINDERRLNYIFQIKSFTCKDSFHIPSYNSLNVFSSYKNDKNKKDPIKTEEAEYILLKKVKGSATKLNDIYANYGIIGLKLNFHKYYYSPPEFVSTFKGLKNIKTQTFYLKFEDNNVNGF